jgi:hypothetical protein
MDVNGSTPERSAGLRGFAIGGKPFPRLGGVDRLTDPGDEFRFRIIMLPTTALIQLNEVASTSVRKLAPLLSKRCVGVDSRLSWHR